MQKPKKSEIEKIEIDLLLEAINSRYGYDFRNYARASLKRRIVNMVDVAEVDHISELIEKILYDPEFFDRFLIEMSVTVTEMFRDPYFFLALRKKIIEILKTYPFVKIWHAGCATGEEVYSMAILLHEEKFLSKVQIYATDYNFHSLETAGNGLFNLEDVLSYQSSYIEGGGRRKLSDYYIAKYKSAKFHDFLKENITFTHHNLVTDGVFGEMHLIICRNVIIYFNKQLQERIFSLFNDSLIHDGFLCLGAKETLEFSDVNSKFKLLMDKERIYQKESGLTYAEV
jgi:chemotaxis protein methyltransferase CheR